MNPMHSSADPAFLTQLQILAGDPPAGSNLSPEERLHLLALFYNLRARARLLSSSELQAELQCVRLALSARGANPKAADLMTQRAAWELSCSLIALADDVARWSNLKPLEKASW